MKISEEIYSKTLIFESKNDLNITTATETIPPLLENESKSKHAKSHHVYEAFIEKKRKRGYNEISKEE